MPPPSVSWLLHNQFKSLQVARFNRCGSLDSLISDAIDESILQAAAEEPAGGNCCFQPVPNGRVPIQTRSRPDRRGMPLGAVFGTFALMLFDQQQAAAERAQERAAVKTGAGTLARALRVYTQVLFLFRILNMAKVRSYRLWTSGLSRFSPCAWKCQAATH